MSKLKDARIWLVLILLISWGLSAGLFFMFKKNNEQVIQSKDQEIVQLQGQIQQIGELVTAYTTVGDVVAGKEIVYEDLTTMTVPFAMATNLVLDPETIIGKYYKLNLKAGTPLTTDLIYEEELTDDLRLFDIVTHVNPIGLEPGSFIDIRIAMPMGEDYVAIPHRKVLEINSGVLKVAVSENDIHVYNSMLVDSIMYPGTQIYAVEYLEGGIQKPAEAFYPASKNIIAIAGKDPNLLNAIRADMLQRREILETGMMAAGVTLTEQQLADLSKTLEQGRKNIQLQLSTSQQEVDRARKEFEQQQQQNP